jgi:hypothetical protein
MAQEMITATKNWMLQPPNKNKNITRHLWSYTVILVYTMTPNMTEKYVQDGSLTMFFPTISRLTTFHNYMRNLFWGLLQVEKKYKHLVFQCASWIFNTFGP